MAALHAHARVAAACASVMAALDLRQPREAPMSRFVLVALLTLPACKIHRLPPLEPERDPGSAAARGTEYRPPPDVLTTELSTGASDDGGGHHHHHHGAAKEAAPAPDTAHSHDESAPKDDAAPAPKSDASHSHGEHSHGEHSPKTDGKTDPHAGHGGAP
jgi:hypothetical protein